MSIYGQSMDRYKLEALSEAYFGKTETLLEIEKQIGVIRATALKKYTDINRSPEVLKLNRLFEKQFGMDVFALYIEQNNTINAYTMVVAKNFDIALNVNMSNMVVGDKVNGYRFAEGNNFCIICNVYLGLIKNPIFTDAEIVAVILHELGHNFADGIYRNIQVANQEMMIGVYKSLLKNVILTVGLYGPTAIKYLITFNNKRKNRINKRTRKRRIKGLFKGVGASVSDFNSYINEIIRRLKTSKYKEAYERGKSKMEDKGLPAAWKRSLSRQNEVIADKFAGIYGYGPEQVSALMKMETKIVSKAAQTVEKIPVIGKIANIDFDDIYKDIYRFDEHPHVIQRLNEELKVLEYELVKGDIDPKLKDAMLDQINQLKDLKDQMTKIDANMSDKDKARAEFFNKVSQEDPDAVDEEIEKAIATAFDDVFEND